MEKLLSSLGPVCAVIGAQWGDEGKGKAIDILAEHFDVIARACGGANAGHTIVVGGKKHVFHLLPAGSLHEGKPVFLGAGMVLHVPTLLEEIKTLKENGIDIVPRLFLCDAAHVLFEFHKEIDGAMEERRAKLTGGKIGTTRRGIGPAYMDKAARTGVRLGQLREYEKSGSLREELSWRAKAAQAAYGISINLETEISNAHNALQLLRGRIVSADVLRTFLEEKKTILIEGAQATLLDIDHGTYPYVTSSQTTAAGALQGLGLPPRALTSCIGVAKAYCTRVGEGAFPAEANGETANRLRERGGEYGATTGRPRRTGWLSIPDLQLAARINGFSAWNITKLDVLDEEDAIPVCVAIDGSGNAIYENLPGWKSQTSGVREFKLLPPAAQNYIKFIEMNTNTPVRLIGTGPRREDMIVG